MSQFIRDRSLPGKLDQFAKYFKPPNNLQTNALQTWVVIAHYKWTVGVLSALFSCILGSWYILTPMECIKKSLDPFSILSYQEDICLSYPYTYTAPRGNGYQVREKVYALHYRWVHWAILFLIPLYSIPILCRKYLEYSYIFTYLNELKLMEIKDNTRVQVISFIVNDYVSFSGWVYKNILLLHLVTLLVDITAFAFIDIALQNRFARLFPLDYPFERWPQYFNDTLSLAFPPFVECNLGPEIMLMLTREETLGCKLSLMILYERVFIVMWVWMVLLSGWSLSTLVYLLILGVCKRFQKSLIHLDQCQRDVNICLKFLPVGSLFILNCLRNLVTSREYKNVLQKISDTMTSLKAATKKNKDNF